MSSPILQMRGIGKRFPGVVALDRVDLEVYRGEAVALIGENGAGKSTLMKILGGVYQPDEGEILVEGQPVVIRSVADAIRLRVSVIYISHRLGEVKEVADRVVVLRDGRNAGALAREEISHDRMVKMMVGRDIESFYAAPEGAARETFFEVRELRTRRYPQHAVSFDVRRGEILGFAGLRGAGGSELAQAVFA